MLGAARWAVVVMKQVACGRGAEGACAGYGGFDQEIAVLIKSAPCHTTSELPLDVQRSMLGLNVKGNVEPQTCKSVLTYRG